MQIAILTTDGRALSPQWADCALPSFGAAPSALMEGLAALPDLQVHVLSAAKDHTLPELELNSNIRWHPLRIGRYDQMRSVYVGNILIARRLIRSISPDIVHGQGTEKDCALAAAYSGLPNVVTIHGNMAELHRLGYHGHKLFGTLASVLESHALRRTGGVFCNSAYTESLVAPRAKRTWRVPNPIRSGFFEPSTGVSDGGVPLLLNVGVVNPRKRQLEVLQSIRRLHHSGTDLKILFAGGLSEETEYGRAFVEELKAAEKEGVAEYVGFLDQRQLVELMDRCSGFVHFPTEEAFGLVVAEALARGLKFFGADLGGIRDIVHGIPSAETYADFDCLERGIQRWMDAGAPRHPEAAIEVEKRYHPTVIARAHLEIYREVLGK